MLRAFVGGVVLAGALSTLAGGAGSKAQPGDGAVATSGRATLRPAQATAQAGGTDAAVATQARGGGAVDQPPAPTAALGAPHNAAPVDPPPHAPGGDDLLATSEPLPPTPRQAAAEAVVVRAPAPRLWLDRPRVALGETVVLHLALTDAPARCRGADALAGVAIVGHRTELRATVAGRHRLTVVCSNAGGTVDAAVVLTVPLPVLPSTGDRRPSPDLGLTPLPGLRQLGLQALALAGVGNQALFAIGDFLQEGQPALFAVAAGPGGAPVVHVLARDVAGRWADRSDDLLDATQRGVCPAAVQLVSADFNRDGLPDVWVACHGRQLLFLSQADGRYRRIETPFSLTARQAEARDVDGDGWPDIVTLDTAAGPPRTLLLLGRGDGRFDTGPAEAWRLALP